MFLAALWGRLWFPLLIGCLLFGLGAGSVWYGVSRKLAAKDTEIDQLKGAQKRAQEQRKKDQATLTHLAREKAAMARSGAAARQSLEQSLAKEPWAEQSVPEETRRVVE